MKERFASMLRHYDAAEKNEQAEQDIASITRNVDEETLSRILEIQASKQNLIAGLMEWRKKFWGGDLSDSENNDGGESFEHAPQARTLNQRADGAFEMPLKGGELISLSKGEVLAATEWGVWWKFGDSVEPALQREIMTHQVRAVIAEQYDKQLIEFGAVNKLSDDRKRDTYQRIEATNKNLDSMPDGILVEKMLLSFLTKEMHDGHLPFRVLKVDVYEDVEHKIDFIITVEGSARRFVQVKEPARRIGIQFTLDASAKERKLEQIRRAMKQADHGEIDQLVLVTMPLEEVRSVFNAWRYDDNGNRLSPKKIDPRGPDHLWSEATKLQVMSGLVEGVGLETS